MNIADASPEKSRETRRDRKDNGSPSQRIVRRKNGKDRGPAAELPNLPKIENKAEWEKEGGPQRSTSRRRKKKKNFFGCAHKEEDMVDCSGTLLHESGGGTNIRGSTNVDIDLKRKEEMQEKPYGRSAGDASRTRRNVSRNGSE